MLRESKILHVRTPRVPEGCALNEFSLVTATQTRVVKVEAIEKQAEHQIVLYLLGTQLMV